jgi:YesN/AraC family two-component response regulator
MNYIDYIKMQEAKKMLLFQNMQVNEISDKLGYNDPLYFSKKFKKRFGQSPKKYKSEYLE